MQTENQLAVSQDFLQKKQQLLKEQILELTKHSQDTKSSLDAKENQQDKQIEEL